MINEVNQYRRFGLPIVKDGCGIFGVLRKKNAPRISSLLPINGISCIKYRGSNLGAGYASFENGAHESRRPYKIKAFVRNRSVAEMLERQLNTELGSLEDMQLHLPDEPARFGVWQANLDKLNCDTELERITDKINLALFTDQKIDGRIFSFGRFVDVYKDVGYPLEVAKLTGLDANPSNADLWIAHTRQPTNSPGSFPIWSHPFASLDCAIVHNGDISSFGANVELLDTWGLKSHVGTDSEVIARLFDHLIRIEKLPVTEAARIITNPFERNVSEETLRLLIKYKGARLDGPFAVLAGYSDENDTYLIALTDRSKFRPIVIGEDEDHYYVASEESQIRNSSKNAKIWAPQPGSFFIASLNRGIIHSGTTRNTDTQHTLLCQALERFQKVVGTPTTIDSSQSEFHELNETISKTMQHGDVDLTIRNVRGQRYLGIGLSPEKPNEFKIRLQGFPGNCMANLNNGGTFEVFGNVADDVADTMHDGQIIIHGNARDVLGQGLQGGHIFVRGGVGNRAAIQMRAYRTHRPYLIVGETADDYLGEYMAGGVVMILNLSNALNPVGDYVGTGMVGGKIYIRGKINDAQIGMSPNKQDILNYLKASMIDSQISKTTFEKVASLDSLTESELESQLPHDLFARIRFIFFSSKYTKHLIVEHRTLQPADLELLNEKLREYSNTFELTETLLESVLESEFTIISVAEEAPATPIPPQEVPVEE